MTIHAVASVFALGPFLHPTLRAGSQGGTVPVAGRVRVDGGAGPSACAGIHVYLHRIAFNQSGFFRIEETTTLETGATGQWSVQVVPGRYVISTVSNLSAYDKRSERDVAPGSSVNEVIRLSDRVCARTQLEAEPLTSGTAHAFALTKEIAERWQTRRKHSNDAMFEAVRDAVKDLGLNGEHDIIDRRWVVFVSERSSDWTILSRVLIELPTDTEAVVRVSRLIRIAGATTDLASEWPQVLWRAIQARMSR